MNKPPDDGWLVKGGSVNAFPPRGFPEGFFFLKQFKKRLFVIRKRIRFCVANKNNTLSTRPPSSSLLLLFVAPRLSNFFASQVSVVFFSQSSSDLFLE